MRAPTRRWRGLTWVGWLNFIVLRWFFVRLTYEVPIDRFVTAAAKDEIIKIDPSMRARWSLSRWIWPTPWAVLRYVGGGRS